MTREEDWNLQQFRKHGTVCDPGVTVSIQALKALVEAADNALETLEHAITLDYLGEGSTLGMAKDAVHKLRQAGCITGND